MSDEALIDLDDYTAILICQAQVKDETFNGRPERPPRRYRQIKISVIGRKSGKTISIPVWFVLEDKTLYLLPVQGSETQWYKNVLKNPTIRIDARGVEAEFRAKPVTGRPQSCEIRGREVPREVRGKGREEVLLEIR